MVYATIPFMAGIVLFDSVSLPWWAVWGGFSLCILLAAVGVRSKISNLYIIAALILFGGIMVSMRGFSPQVPHSQSIYMQLEIEDKPVIRKAFAVAPARIVGYEFEGRNFKADQRVNLYVDTLIKADFGTRIEALGRILPFPEKFGSYGKLMSRRGFGGTVFLHTDNVLKIEDSQRRSLHSEAVKRLSRLPISGDEAAIIGAMSISDRRGMTPELRRAYARTGVSHILAVSGLHVGIVFMLFNALLAWLSFVHNGQIIRAVLVIAPIWIYAAICGFSPSVVRAATMFTALQATVATSSRYVSLNILAATAFMMLVYRPDYLFDISLQLSFIAVAAIVVWGVPLMRTLRSGRWWLDMLMTTTIVGAVSSIATMPLVAHTFGMVSIVGFVLNPLVILCAYIIVTIAVLWIAMPITFLSGLVGAILSGVGSAMNFVIGQMSAWQWSAVDVALPSWAVWLIYCVAIVLTAIARNIETKKSIPLLP